MIRDGPGGRVAVQLPSGPVVTAAACVNAFEPLSGAVRIATGWPASGRPALLISSPCRLTGRPKPTLAWVVGASAERLQLRLRLRRSAALPTPQRRAYAAVGSGVAASRERPRRGAGCEDVPGDKRYRRGRRTRTERIVTRNCQNRFPTLLNRARTSRSGSCT